MRSKPCYHLQVAKMYLSHCPPAMKNLSVTSACHFSLTPYVDTVYPLQYYVLVVTPLLSIVKDQVSDLGSKQILAIHVTSNRDETIECAILDSNSVLFTSARNCCLGRSSGEKFCDLICFNKI